MFAVSVGDSDFKLLFIAIMLFFQFIEYKYEPFVIHQANQMEFILLLCLIFIIFIQFTVSATIYQERY